jgi:hypothetical protein
MEQIGARPSWARGLAGIRSWVLLTCFEIRLSLDLVTVVNAYLFEGLKRMDLR